jgi:hypothetical protein
MAFAWPGRTVKALIVALMLSLLIACTVCRETAIRDAERYTVQGYEARIATYDLKLDGLLYGGFLWTHHAQAQVYRNGKWYWVCEINGLCDSPTFSVKRIVVLWDVEEYKRAIGFDDDRGAGQPAYAGRLLTFN